MILGKPSKKVREGEIWGGLSILTFTFLGPIGPLELGLSVCWSEVLVENLHWGPQDESRMTQDDSRMTPG